MNKQLQILSVAFASALFAAFTSSCQDEEVANIKELSYRHNYETNFIKTFGEISPNQVWDFTSYARTKAAQNALTRATVNDFGIQFDSEGFFRIPTEVHDWIFANVMEENGMANNKERIKDELWHAFSFEALNTEAFDLLPFYLGASQSLYSFHMVVVDPETDQVVSNTDLWDLSGDTHMQWTSGNGKWHDISGSTGSGGHGSTMEATTTRAKPILIDFSDPKYGLTKDNIKYVVYFTINVSVGHPQINEAGDVLTSITHTPNVVAIDLPAEIDALTNGQGYNSMLFGVETGSPNKIERTDYDFNDLMFLLVGRIPDIYYDEMEQTVIIKKRYMIEDLYDFDYDFNDIVVDATQTKISYYIINESTGEKTEQTLVDGKTYPVLTQEATVQHLCGTLPFQIKIGNHTFGQVTDPTNATLTSEQLAREASVYGGAVTAPGSSTGIDPAFTAIITGWDPDTNNVSAYIWTDNTDPTIAAMDSSDGLWTGAEGIWASVFPEAGAVPYIIAVDQDVNWMPELQHIPTNWLGGDMTTDKSTETITNPITTNP